MALEDITNSMEGRLAREKRAKEQEYRPKIEKYDMLGNLY
jgi:hypothetical protein